MAPSDHNTCRCQCWVPALCGWFPVHLGPLPSPGISSWLQPLASPLTSPLAQLQASRFPDHSYQPCSLGSQRPHGEEWAHTDPEGTSPGGRESHGRVAFPQQRNLDVQSAVTTTPGREQPSLSDLQLTGCRWSSINEPQFIGAVLKQQGGAQRLPLRRQTGKSHATEVSAQRNCLINNKQHRGRSFRPLRRSQADR